MLCSKCSEKVRPIVAVDIDGTLGDYHGHFLSFACDWLGRNADVLEKESYNGKAPFSQYCMLTFKINLDTYRQIKLAYRQGGMKRSMPIHNGAADLCHQVRELEAELWVTTTRPYLSLDNIVPDTVEWLSRHHIQYDHMLFDEDKYTVLSNRIDNERVVAILDDLPEYYDAAADLFGVNIPILVSSEYNRAVNRPFTLPLIICGSEIKSRLQEWRSNCGS